jgi:hypothetical protein
VVLVIDLRRRGAEADDAVVVGAGRLAVRHAEQQVAAVAPRDAGEVREVTGVDLVEPVRHRRLRQHDQLRFRAFSEAGIGLEDLRVALRPELHLLRDVALQERSFHRRTLGRRPHDVAQRLAGAERREENDDCNNGFDLPAEKPDRPGEREREETHRIDPAERRVALRRPADAGVADRDPREAGENHAAQPFEQRPRRGHEQQDAHCVARRDARLQPAGRRREKREERAEHECRERRERRRHAAELGHEASRRGFVPAMRQIREGDQRDRIHAERREGDDRRRAGNEGARAAPYRLDHALGLSTSSV